jgi:hypothetical protein
MREYSQHTICKIGNTVQQIQQIDISCKPSSRRLLTMAIMLMIGPQTGPKLHRAFGIFSGDLMRRYKTLEMARMYDIACAACATPTIP